MRSPEISRATLGRIPLYIRHLKSLPQQTSTISSTAIAKELGLGDVQVRKDLGALCGSGKPKVGYNREELLLHLEGFLNKGAGETVIMGAGKLGCALLDYDGFSDYGMKISAAFDKNTTSETLSEHGNPILPLSSFESYCREHDIRLGIIAVPAEAAQSACNLLCANGVKAIWSFARCQLYKPADVIIQYEDMALSLAHLKIQLLQ